MPKDFLFALIFCLSLAALAWAPLASPALSLAQEAASEEVNDHRVAQSEEAISEYLAGSFGALVMVGSGLLAIASLPLAVAIIVVCALMGKQLSTKWMVLLLGSPVIFLGIAVLTFVIRSALATFAT